MSVCASGNFEESLKLFLQTVGAAETLDIPSFEDVAVPPVSSSFKTKEKDVPVKKSRTLEPELSDLSSIRATRAEEEAAPA